jgi:hypothetical protein
MATTDDRLAIRHLEAARDRLVVRGDAEAVSSLDAIIGRLEDSDDQAAHEPAVPSVPASSDLLTAREAAEILGVTSVSPVWRWVKQGKLTTQRADGWIRITRDSVEKLLDDPALHKEHAHAAELARILAPFDATEEDLAEMYDWYDGPAKLDDDD